MNLKTETKTALIDLELISYSHAAKAESTGTGLKSLVEMVEFTIQSVVSACRAQEHYLVVLHKRRQTFIGWFNFSWEIQPTTLRG